MPITSKKKLGIISNSLFVYPFTHNHVLFLFVMFTFLVPTCQQLSNRYMHSLNNVLLSFFSFLNRMDTSYLVKMRVKVIELQLVKVIISSLMSIME